MNDEDIDQLLDQGKDFCDYFEHVLISLGLAFSHSKNGCKFCVREKEKKDD